MNRSLIKTLMLIIFGSLSSMGFSGELHSEVSLLINDRQASEIIRDLNLKLSKRVDHYLDYYQNGRFLFLSDQSKIKMRLMVDDSKNVKMQVSHLKSLERFDCGGSSFTVVTKISDELKGKSDVFSQMVVAHHGIMDALVHHNIDQLYLSEKSLLSLFNSVSFGSSYGFLSDEKYPGTLTASYASSKKKFKRNLTMESEQNIELSITFARNYLSSEIFKDEISLEFEKIGEYSNEDFSDHVCKLAKKLSVPVEEGHSSSPVIWHQAEYLNRLLRDD